jgi:hypothetical protein
MNLPLGAILVVVAALFDTGVPAVANTVVVGALLFALGFVRGRITGEFGGGWSSLWTGRIAGESDDDWTT